MRTTWVVLLDVSTVSMPSPASATTVRPSSVSRALEQPDGRGMLIGNHDADHVDLGFFQVCSCP